MTSSKNSRPRRPTSRRSDTLDNEREAAPEAASGTAPTTVQDALHQVKPSDLPSPPQVALEIMRACARDNLSSAELSRITATDPVLTAELLRVANSPFFGGGREIGSIARGITVLGHRTLRNLALCLAVRDALHRDAPAGFEIDEFWEDALLRAVSARLLGRRAGLDADDCFTAGILQDFGLQIMIYLNPGQAALWPVLRELDPDRRLAYEFERFGMTHDAVVALLASEWDLPDDLGIALGEHHYRDEDGSPARRPGLARVLYCADWMAAVYRASERDATLSRCRDLLTGEFGLADARIFDLWIQVPEQMAAAASALGLKIRRDPTLERRVDELRTAFSGD